MVEKLPPSQVGPSSRPASSLGRRDAMRAAARRPSIPLDDHRDCERRGLDVEFRHQSPLRLFVSYARGDLKTVTGLVGKLRGRGHAISWDQDFIAGENFERRIRDEIAASDAVIVVWSKLSVKSEFVLDEVRLARETGKLIASHLHDFDVRLLPLGYGRIHSISIEDDPAITRSLSKFSK